MLLIAITVSLFIFNILFILQVSERTLMLSEILQRQKNLIMFSWQFGIVLIIVLGFMDLFNWYQFL
jgi:hypothetical protein